jgi:uncharacterized protein with HEPN domain
MRENKDKIHLERILEAIDRIEFHLLGFEFDYFKNDKTRYDAVLMQLVNIGETVNQLSDKFQEKHNDFPWYEIIGMRNQIAHGYFNIDPKEIWKTVKNDLPTLKKQIKLILENY